MLSSKGYKVPIQGNEKHMKKLTLYSEVRSDFPGPKPKIICYRRSKESLYLPRYYGIEEIGKPTHKAIDSFETFDLKFKGELRDHQKEVIEKTLKNFEKGPKGGIWSLFTGFGKTFCALFLVAKMKMKTIIIVHKQVLMDQWKERIKEFIPESSIGTIQGPTIDIENKQIVIAMVQSLTRKEYPSNIFKQFGLTIIDEIHTICSKTFSESLFMIQTKYRIGLSATPKRKDGFDKIFYYHLGPTIVDIHKIIIKPEIRFSRAPTTEVQIQMNSLGKVNLPKLITDLSLDESRNDFIIDTIIDTMTNENRKMLVFSDRVQQCKILKNKFNQKIKNKSSDTFIGEKKKEELDEALTKDVIFATYGICKEGFDCPSLDTLLFATPKSDVVQAVGRILRKKGQYTPLVLDIIDYQFGNLKGQYYKRRKFYKEKDFLPSEEDTREEKPQGKMRFKEDV